MVRGVVAAFVVAATATPAAASPIRLDVSGDACSLDSLETPLPALAGTDPALPPEERVRQALRAA